MNGSFFTIHDTRLSVISPNVVLNKKENLRPIFSAIVRTPEKKLSFPSHKSIYLHHLSPFKMPTSFSFINWFRAQSEKHDLILFLFEVKIKLRDNVCKNLPSWNLGAGGSPQDQFFRIPHSKTG